MVTIIAITVALVLLGMGFLAFKTLSAPVAGVAVIDISPAELKEALRSNPDLVLVDVRTPQEYKGGHIKGALQLNYFSGDFKRKIMQLDKDKPIYLYCRSGNRSSKAARLLAQQGHQGPVYNLAGGFMAWRGN